MCIHKAVGPTALLSQCWAAVVSKCVLWASIKGCVQLAGGAAETSNEKSPQRLSSVPQQLWFLSFSAWPIRRAHHQKPLSWICSDSRAWAALCSALNDKDGRSRWRWVRSDRRAGKTSQRLHLVSALLPRRGVVQARGSAPESAACPRAAMACSRRSRRRCHMLTEFALGQIMRRAAPRRPDWRST